MSHQTDKSPRFDVYDHPRLSDEDHLVYPVVSRRAGGVSLGINLNPSKNCSFHCIYCQVDRSTPIDNLSVNLEQIERELAGWLDTLKNPSHDLSGIPLKDISIAGDGEPTLCRQLPDLIDLLVGFKSDRQLDGVGLILFTNGSSINRKALKDRLPAFFQAGGQIWFKLDFWDERSYLAINRSKVPYRRILDNLVEIGSLFPLVLQSCFFSRSDQPFQLSNVQRYAALIAWLLEKGVKLEEIQVYTIARKPSESSVKPLSNSQMDELFSVLDNQIDVPIKLIYSSGQKEA